jgi:hypothetical protein
VAFFARIQSEHRLGKTSDIEQIKLHLKQKLLDLTERAEDIDEDLSGLADDDSQSSRGRGSCW